MPKTSLPHGMKNYVIFWTSTTLHSRRVQTKQPKKTDWLNVNVCLPEILSNLVHPTQKLKNLFDVWNDLWRRNSSGKSGILRITHATQVRGWLRQAWHPKTVQNGSYQTKGPKNPLTWPSCEISWQGTNSTYPSKPLSLVCLLFLSNIYAPFQSIPNWPVAIGMTGMHTIRWLSREAAVLLLLTHRPCLVAIAC